ncbi:MAG: zinc-dependent alcohol dehydrogenase family protein [Pseudomonadales bacterium]|nr:zinc-dependent alcohol dehydrogenase family protein [Pseudomonadales bacterium]
MKAMQMMAACQLTPNSEALLLSELPVPKPGPYELLVKVAVCGVCHTELDEIEGRAPPRYYPIVPGHQVVGGVAETGSNVTKFSLGKRVGIAWIYSACGACDDCLQGFENLCEAFQATGRDVNGGYAEYMLVNENFALAIPDNLSSEVAAPLLCAGAIGYRSMKLAGIQDGQPLGLTGFGASAHLVLKMVRNVYPNTEVYVFARNAEERQFALELGAVWSGVTEDVPPCKLAAIIDTTPVWKTLVHALTHLQPNGRLVINAIRKEDKDKDYLLNLDYPTQLWLEKEIKSVANVTRRDVEEFLQLADRLNLLPEVQIYPLEEANRALCDLKFKRVKGAKILVIGDEIS